MNYALLNCPFCNAEVELQRQPDSQSPNGEYFFIACYCDTATVTAFQSGSTDREAAKKWNTRHDRLYDPLIATARSVVAWMDRVNLSSVLPCNPHDGCMFDDLTELGMLVADVSREAYLLARARSLEEKIEELKVKQNQYEEENECISGKTSGGCSQ